MPGEFIALAEETGQILALGRWVLDEACRQLAEWASRGVDVTVAVNVASKQFAQPSFLDEVRSALESHGVSARSLQIEITEGATMAPHAIETCARLAEMGIRLHLDDFGTGYSSLSYLTRMPIHALKIDRSFVAHLLDDPMSAAITQTVLTLADALGMETIAEGVETAAQAVLLREMKCSTAQGYLWSKPVDAERALQLLAPKASAPMPASASGTNASGTNGSARLSAPPS
jgi:EAL domain-containing protein (putative c-di-GMP-specific phosphodiesterase class I)